MTCRWREDMTANTSNKKVAEISAGQALVVVPN
jgi:hypothetical protein